MEECGRGAAVEQLTTRGKYQSPRWGAIERDTATQPEADLSIPAMGGNRLQKILQERNVCINPRDGGQ